MKTYRADWIVPVAGRPLRRGCVTVHAGRVVAVGSDPAVSGDDVVDLGPVALLPGLVNAHTHLELSWLRGRVPPARVFVDWVVAMMGARGRGAGAPDAALRRTAVGQALAELRAAGTAAIGDVSNGLADLDLLGASGLCGVVFHELLGFNVPDPQARVGRAVRTITSLAVPAGWRVTLAPHAPYSASPALCSAIRQACGGDPRATTAIHVAEAAEEVELLATGSGRWRAVLQTLGAWDPAWTVPACSPVEYLDRLGFWAPGTLAVHAVLAGSADLARLRDRGATVVTCPRSNRHVGAGTPPVEQFYRSGVGVAVGTDSLGSVEDLNLFSELDVLRRLAPGVPARRLIESATIEGARALGLQDDFGSIEAGKRAALIAVRVPPATADVEQYLVGGIAPGQIQWIESGQPC